MKSDDVNHMIDEMTTNRSHEWVDDGGYPTEEFLGRIEKWDVLKGKNSALMKFIKRYWRYSSAGFWSEKEREGYGTEYKISTGGWSGNEAIIEALKNNRLFWNLYWIQSRRGGHYIFEVKDKE